MPARLFAKTIKKHKILNIILLIIAVCLLITSSFASQDQKPNTVLRSRVRKLKHIPAEDAKKLLIELQLSTDISILNQNALLVTSDNSLNLIKSSSVLELIDSTQLFAVTTITPPDPAAKPPDPETISAQLNNLPVGTFLEPPLAGDKPAAIVDIHNGTWVIIAPNNLLEPIVQYINTLLPPAEPTEPTTRPKEKTPSEQLDDLLKLDTQTPAAKVSEPNMPSEEQKTIEPSEDDFFQEQLFEALAQTEKRVQQLKEQQKEQKLTVALQRELAIAQREIERLNAALAERQAQQKVQTETPQETKAEQDALLEILKKMDTTQPQEPQPDKTTEQKPEPRKEPPTPTTPAIPDAEKQLELTITLPEKVEITELIELVGKQLGLNYIYDPAIVKGDVTLKIHDGKIKVKDTYALLESVLKFRGFVMTRRPEGNLVTIVKKESAVEYDPVIRTPDEQIQPGDVIVTSIFRLKYISTDTAEAMLTNMSLGTTFNSIPETKTLVVTEYAYRMDRIKKLLDMVDVPGEPQLFEFRELLFTTASDMVPRVQTLAEQLESVSITISAAPQAPTPPATTRDPRTGRTVRTPLRPTTARPTTTAKPEPTEKTVYLEADDRTNRIIMIGKAEHIKTVNELIDSLDVPQHSLKFIEEYEIDYIDAADVVDVLGELGIIQTTTRRTTTPYQRTPSRTSPSSRTRTGAQAPQPTTQLTTATTDLDLEQPNISIRETSNSLLVNATAEQHDEIELVISHIDVEQKDSRAIKEYEIQHVDATEIVDTLTELGIISTQKQTSRQQDQQSRTQSRTQPRTSTADRIPEAPVPTLPSVEGTFTEVYAEEPQIAILESTNSLLINATPRQHAAVALIIAHVDREPDMTTTPYVVYALENQEPDILAETLNSLIQETVIQQPQGDSKNGKIQTKVKPGVLKEDETIKIIPDIKSYSLIIYANKKNQQWISSLIKTLDEYRPQVLLDVTLVEITKQDDFNYDLNVLNSVPSLTHMSGITGTVVAGDDPLLASEILSNLNATDVDRSKFIDLQSDSGNLTAFYGDDQIMALLTAIQTKKYGRILAKPKLLVDDNQEGTIQTKTTTYITRAKVTYRTGQDNEQIPITEDTFDPYDAEITLGIKPHISKGDNLRLDITLSRSDFLNLSTTSNKPPDIALSDLSTVVTVPDSSTIILGGMEKINQSKGGDKVPILGDIPFVGGLFRSTSDSSLQSNLYIFIKARILRPGTDMTSQDLIDISRKNRADFESVEAEMQAYEDWPGIKAEPMDPLQILEEDVEKL
jgi:type II secretory pathway component GspD/PulD (secretin)